MSWVSKSINLGVVTVGADVPFEFIYQGTKTVTGATGTCNCTVASHSANRVSGKFISKRGMASKTKVTKNITVTFNDGSSETLTVEAKVVWG